MMLVLVSHFILPSQKFLMTLETHNAYTQVFCFSIFSYVIIYSKVLTQ